jgi:hypothetical protein
MGERKKIAMKFMCDQDWDEMQGTANGRYCDVCRKEVIDYTTKSIKDIPSDQDLCGRFLIEQIDTSIIKPIQTPKQIKTIGFISTLLISVFSKTSYAQTTTSATKTEQVESNPNSSDTLIQTPVRTKIINGEIVEKEKTQASPFLTTYKRYYYWTKKFPFIVRKKRRRPMGKF